MSSVSCNADLQSLAPFADCTDSHSLVKTVHFSSIRTFLPHPLSCNRDPVKSSTRHSQRGLDQDHRAAAKWAEWSPASLASADRLSPQCRCSQEIGLCYCTCSGLAGSRFVCVCRLMTNEEKRMADMEAAIESKDSRTRALLKEKEEKIIRVKLLKWSYLCTKSVSFKSEKKFSVHLSVNLWMYLVTVLELTLTGRPNSRMIKYNRSCRGSKFVISYWQWLIP